jgi:hypothetical protein
MKNNNAFKWFLVWVLAVSLTAVAMVYQSLNGPTKPKRIELWLNDSQIYNFKLPRSHGGKTNCLVELKVPDVKVSGEMFFRRYPTNEHWQQIRMIRVGDKLAAFLPCQPPAGKLEYYLVFRQGQEIFRIPAGEHVVIRFRGDVPAWVILPHALLMFIAMLLSNVTFFLILFNMKQYRLFGMITLAALFVGGMVFGPMVQKYAFGQYWTGFPYGLDMTDNKTLIAFIFWCIAVMANMKKDRKLLVVLAALVMLVIFTIPHSAKGSELDPETGKIRIGMVHAIKTNKDWEKYEREAGYCSIQACPKL